MHGLIFETSVWLLAGSTRFVSFKVGKSLKDICLYLLAFSYLVLPSRVVHPYYMCIAHTTTNNPLLKAYQNQLQVYEHSSNCFKSTPLLANYSPSLKPFPLQIAANAIALERSAIDMYNSSRCHMCSLTPWPLPNPYTPTTYCPPKQSHSLLFFVKSTSPNENSFWIVLPTSNNHFPVHFTKLNFGLDTSVNAQSTYPVHTLRP